MTIDDDVDINRAWETNREYIKISAKESRTWRRISHGLMRDITIRWKETSQIAMVMGSEPMEIAWKM
jgi:hypothetical protein